MAAESSISVSNFIVLERQLDGTLVEHTPNSREYTFIASAINIALSVLETQTCRHWLIELAIRVDHHRPQQHGGSKFHGDRATMRPWIDWFLAKLRASFPAVVINHTMTTIDNLGATLVTPWNGELSDFNPRITMIYLNGSRVADMLAAEAAGLSQRFRDFQFLFAMTLLHETGGHVLTMFLNNGRVGTPLAVTVAGYGNLQENEGESGRWLEMHLLNGTMEYYRNHSQDNGQTGIPHQLDNNGWAWRIDPAHMNDIVQYRFDFPLRRIGSAVDRRTMQQMGQNSRENPVNPRERQMLAALRYDARSIDVDRFRGFTIRVRDLRAIPINMTRRLTAVI